MRDRSFKCLHIFAKFILFLLLLINIIYAKDKEETTVIKSNKLNKKEKDVIVAIGNVEIQRGDHVLNAKEVEYNQTTKKIKSNSNVKVYNMKDDSMFFSKTAIIDDDLINANFYDGLMIFKDGSSILSPHMSRENKSIINMDDTEYRVCPTNIYNEKLTYEEAIKELEKQKTPLFSLKSYKATANTDDKTLKLVGTSFWFWKIPFFFVPYLNTSYNYTSDVNGFGTPKLESNSHYGYGISIPYRIRTQNQMFRITPKVYTDGNFLTNIKYSINSNENKWSFGFEGDIANDNGQSKDLTNAYGITELDEGDYKKWRGFFASNGFLNINDIWKINYDGKIASDKYYLRDYYNDNSEYIQSYINLTRVNLDELYDFNTFEFTNLFYQDLLEDNNINNPRYAPVSNLNIQDYIFKNDNSNLIYKVQTNTTNLFRVHGLQYNRFTLMPSINYMINNNILGTINSNLQLIGDSYFFNNLKYISNAENYSKNENILTPQFNFEWRKSFIFGDVLIQPIVKYSASPNTNVFENKIINEDVGYNILSFDNMFLDNRYYGYDRREVGNRISYGFEGIFNNFTFGLAQGYKDNMSGSEYLIGFNDNFSDYVGYASYIFNNNLDIYYKFLLDKENLDLKAEELTTNLNFKYINLYLTYTNIRSTIYELEAQKQISSGILLTLYNNWKIELGGIIDLEANNRLLESNMGLIYDGGCTRWEIVYNSSNPLTETDKSTSINFNFVIKFL